jgi:hypothetical protein
MTSPTVEAQPATVGPSLGGRPDDQGRSGPLTDDQERPRRPVSCGSAGPPGPGPASLAGSSPVTHPTRRGPGQATDRASLNSWVTGMSNQRIAAALGITTRTVELRVEHGPAKVSGPSRRTAAARAPAAGGCSRPPAAARYPRATCRGVLGASACNDADGTARFHLTLTVRGRELWASVPEQGDVTHHRDVLLHRQGSSFGVACPDGVGDLPVAP